MTDGNVLELNDPEQNDPLEEVLRDGARKMLAAAIESEKLFGNPCSMSSAST